MRPPVRRRLLALAAAAAAWALAMGPSAVSAAPPTIHDSKGTFPLDPSSQHVPLDAAQAELRPPPPRVPPTFDLFVGLSVFRDGVRCGRTVFTGLSRAQQPSRVRFGIVDQVNPGDARCVDEYCKLAREAWPEHGACRYREQLRVDERLADDSRGPTLARHYQQKLVRDEEFCLQLDSHSIFTNGWDANLVADWRQADNEMAVLSTYLHDLHSYVQPNGDNAPPSLLPHLCTTIRGGHGNVRNEGASMISDATAPQLTALWGAGLSFSKCHAERRVPIDPHTLWMFDGEEFLRASHLWTHGYDMYSPSPLGTVVYHNYSRVPARFENVKVDEAQKAIESEMGANRFKLIVGVPFKGAVDALEMDKYAFGAVRSFAQYLQFSGVTFEEGKKDEHSCKQLHWVPYADPREVEQLVGGGWRMRAAKRSKQAEPEPEPTAAAAIDAHALHGADAGAGADHGEKPEARRGLPRPGLPTASSAGALLYVGLFAAVAWIAFAKKHQGSQRVAGHDLNA
ncbi:hypothetical protein P43SY_005351 [Pythium insidiosum]|uniref:GlcNac transferase n=1 Tax=Pythium insidiosum TaxID=114742 RepID=A0AAD5QDS7_PYTIN|nr:hypothetical protein P43SY_005351 [Pythium insidiosum]